MGGRGKNGKYPTIQIYWCTIYFFNGFVESSYTGGSYGKPTPMQFLVDKWGTKFYYFTSYSMKTVGKGVDAVIEPVEMFVGGEGSPWNVNLLDQALGKYWRMEFKKGKKIQKYPNRTYPAWALADG